MTPHRPILLAELAFWTLIVALFTAATVFNAFNPGAPDKRTTTETQRGK